MPVPMEDWIKDTAWTEMHLTATGWLRGTKRTEKGRYENEVAPPPDCLMTVRSLECVPADPREKQTEWTEIRWRIPDAERIEQAQENWGVLPRSAPPLSPQSASKHLALKNLSTMRLSELRRPLGKRVKKERTWW
jgi:hypothetical protein